MNLVKLLQWQEHCWNYDANGEKFKEIYDSHELIISKGMGNFEGLTELDLSNKNVYFLLATKCSTISKYNRN